MSEHLMMVQNESIKVVECMLRCAAHAVPTGYVKEIIPILSLAERFGVAASTDEETKAMVVEYGQAYPEPASATAGEPDAN